MSRMHIFFSGAYADPTAQHRRDAYDRYHPEAFTPTCCVHHRDRRDSAHRRGPFRHIQIHGPQGLPAHEVHRPKTLRRRPVRPGRKQTAAAHPGRRCHPAKIQRDIKKACRIRQAFRFRGRNTSASPPRSRPADRRCRRCTYCIRPARHCSG